MDPGRLHFSKLQLNDAPQTMPPIRVRQEILDWIDESLKGRNIPYPVRLSPEEKEDKSLFLHLLHFDVREEVYNQILGRKGLRIHVSDSGSHRARPLMAIMCDDVRYENCLSCGHEHCETDITTDTGTDTVTLTQRSRSELETIMSLLKTCKSLHLEISKYLYTTLTFVFNAFADLERFLDQASPTDIANVRRVGFIVNILDTSTQEDFQSIMEAVPEKDERLALLERFTGLRHLEINFFLDPIKKRPFLDVAGLAAALDLLSQKPDIVFRVPNTRPEEDDKDEDGSDEDNDADGDEADNPWSVAAFTGRPGMTWSPEVSALAPYDNMTLVRCRYAVRRGIEGHCQAFRAPAHLDQAADRREE